MISLCRRTVLKGAAAGCGAGLLAACGGQETAAPAREDGALAQVTDVPVGGAVLATAPDGTKVLVTRPDESQTLAFSSVCPHQGCTVAPDDGRLACPCHGSQFALDGSLQRGPAEKSLTPYAVSVVDGRVLPA